MKVIEGGCHGVTLHHRTVGNAFATSIVGAVTAIIHLTLIPLYSTSRRPRRLSGLDKTHYRALSAERSLPGAPNKPHAVHAAARLQASNSPSPAPPPSTAIHTSLNSNFLASSRSLQRHFIFYLTTIDCTSAITGHSTQPHPLLCSLIRARCLPTSCHLKRKPHPSAISSHLPATEVVRHLEIYRLTRGAQHGQSSIGGKSTTFEFCKIARLER